MTATTAHSASVWRYMQKCAQVDWPELDVTLTPVTDHWASLAIAGPHARDLLMALEPDFDVSREALPFAAVRQGQLSGIPVRVFSVSFSGELSYEINVPAGFAEDFFDLVMDRGSRWNITPYGLETLDVLRIEKGHLAIGGEIDGRHTAKDLGLGRMVSAKKDLIGRALAQRPALQAEGREELVGLVPEDRTEAIPPASCLSTEPMDAGGCAAIQGYLTAAVKSPTLGHSVALAFLKDGHARTGDQLWAHSTIAKRSVKVRVVPSCFYDPEGEKVHG